MMDEQAVSAAGTVYRMGVGALYGMIEGAGYEPLERDYYYQPINPLGSGRIQGNLPGKPI